MMKPFLDYDGNIGLFQPVRSVSCLIQVLIEPCKVTFMFIIYRFPVCHTIIFGFTCTPNGFLFFLCKP